MMCAKNAQIDQITVKKIKVLDHFSLVIGLHEIEVIGIIKIINVKP